MDSHTSKVCGHLKPVFSASILDGYYPLQSPMYAVMWTTQRARMNDAYLLSHDYANVSNLSNPKLLSF